MRLPNSELADVPLVKTQSYLLSDTHPVGRTKAKFFRGLGYSAENPEELVLALLQIARTDPVIETEKTPYGVKYVIEGSLISPAGQIVNLRTIWIVEIGQENPRFVTAYPA